MSMMVSFVLSFFPRDVLDEILNLIESVSEDFPSYSFSVINPPKLLEDLEEDPFINHAPTSICCELYYQNGMYLTPFTAMLTTAKHINFNKNKNAIDKNGDPGNLGSSGTSENSGTH